MSARVHPTAIVGTGAELGAGVSIGPYAIVSGAASIGEDSEIGPHTVIDGTVRIGRRCRVQGQASIGAPPQDLKYAGGATAVEIGDDTIVREFVTVNRATEHGGGTTRVGASCMLMAYAHVAHDCQVGTGVVMANAATLAGHVTVEDHAIVGGLVAIHQFVRIGESAILGGGAMVTMDVPPYCMAAGDRARLQGLNVIGLRRRGFSEAEIQALHRAYRTVFQSKLPRKEALAVVAREHAGDWRVEKFRRFLETSERGVCR